MRIFSLVSLLASLTFGICFGQTTLQHASTYGELNEAVYGQGASRIAKDNNGNIFQTGTLGYGVSFQGGGQILNSGTGRDMYVAKRNAQGEFLWKFSIVTTSDNISVFGIDTDNDGNVVVCGRLDGTADFDPSSDIATVTTPNNPKGFIAKYSGSGELIWVRNFGSSSWYTYAEDVLIDQNNNIYVAGDMGNNLTFGSTTIIDSAPSLYVLKVSPGGSLEWMETYFGVLDSANEKLADLGDRIRVYSSFGGWLDFDPGPGQNLRSSVGGNDLMFVEINKSNGDYINAGPIPRNNEQRITQIEGYEDGKHAYLFQNYEDDKFIGSSMRASYDPNGYTQFASTTNQVITGFYKNENNELYLTVYGGASVTYNPINAQYEIEGDGNSYLRKYTPVGTLAKESTLHTDSYLYPSYFIGDNDNEILISGTFIGKASFVPDQTELDFSAAGRIEGFISGYSDFCDLIETEEEISGCIPIEHNNEVYTKSGIYPNEEIDESGCVSVHYLTVEADSVNRKTYVTDSVIRCEEEGALYEWKNADTNELYSETSFTFTPPGPGNYQFSLVTELGCIYESFPITFPVKSIEGMQEYSQFGNTIHYTNEQLFVGGELDVNSSVLHVLDKVDNSFDHAQTINPFWVEFGADVLGYEDKLVVGSPVENQDGAVHSYSMNNGTWQDGITFSPTNFGQAYVEDFGRALATYKDLVFVGAPKTELVGLKDDAGFVQVFSLQNDEWVFVANIVNLGYQEDYRFGEDIVVHGSELFISEPGYTNESGLGRVHRYAIKENSNGMYSFEKRGNITSTSSFANFRPEINIVNDQVVLNNYLSFAVFNEDNELEFSYTVEGGEILDRMSTDGSIISLSMDFHLPSLDNKVVLYDFVQNELQNKREIYSYNTTEQFGKSILLSEETLFVGAPAFKNESGEEVGKVYVYDLSDLASSSSDYLTNEYSLNVFPNPGSQSITFILDNEECENCAFRVIDQLGKVQLKGFGNNIDISGLKEGVQFLKVSNKDGKVAITSFIKI